MFSDYNEDATACNLQAFMYTDKHGEVCPAGWQPGADTIIPDPKVSNKLNYRLLTKNIQEKLAYFKKQGDL